ncbi:YOPP/AvrRxv family protein [Ralstonia pseudosolanacearum]|nr:YOPP/AvrRxv family protein [Ralstonia pseudosolanacearum]
MKVSSTSAGVPANSTGNTNAPPSPTSAGTSALGRRRKAPEDAPGSPPARRQRQDASEDSAQTMFRRAGMTSRPPSPTSPDRVPLLDNRPTLERMGVDHPLPGHTWYDAAHTTISPDRVSATHAPQVGSSSRSTYPTAAVKPQPASLSATQQATVERMRTQVTAFLSGALGRLQDLNARNMDPELAEFRILDVDRAITPLLIVTENARNPGLNLMPLHMDTAEDEEVRTQPPMAGSRHITEFMASAQPGRYRALIDDGSHTRAADIRKDASGTSVIVVDPLRKEKDENAYADYADNVNSEFGEDAKCAFIPVDIQKSFFDCRTLSLSLALKMQDKDDAFATLHDTLRNGGDPSQSVSRAERTEQLGALLVLDGAPLVDASMMKHSQAGSSVTRYLDQHPEQAGVPVNKRNETLSARTTRHLVKREVRNRANSEGQVTGGETKQITFSNSIEQKRIAMLSRAISYVDSAPPPIVIRMAKLLQNSILNGD